MDQGQSTQRRRRRSKKEPKPQFNLGKYFTVPTFLNLEIGRKRLLPLFILFIAFIGIVNAFRFGGASLDYYSVKNSISLWINKGTAQSQTSYESAKASISTANVLHHSNPLYLELDAQIKEWGVLSGFEADMGLQAAQASYLLASKSRPLWPVTWANLAMLKWRKQEFDDEMLSYLNKAHTLGLQKAEVHILFTQLGLSLYQANHPFYRSIREQTQTHIKKGIRANPSRNQIVAFIKDNGHHRTVCRWLDVNDDAFAISMLGCQKA